MFIGTHWMKIVQIMLRNFDFCLNCSNNFAQILLRVMRNNAEYCTKVVSLHASKFAKKEILREIVQILRKKLPFRENPSSSNDTLINLAMLGIVRLLWERRRVNCWKETRRRRGRRREGRKGKRNKI